MSTRILGHRVPAHFVVAIHMMPTPEESLTIRRRRGLCVIAAYLLAVAASALWLLVTHR